MIKTKNKANDWKTRLRNWSAQLIVMLVLLLSLEAFLTRGALGIVAPGIEATTLKRQAFSLEQFKGEAAIVHFWATWCSVCELEQGMINELASEFPMITVAMQSGTDTEISDYLVQKGVNYPVINDHLGTLSSSYGVKAVPMSFILNSEGKVRFATRGYTTGLGMRLRLWVAGMM